MRVLLWGNFNYNGATRHLLCLARELNQNHCEITLLAPNMPYSYKKSLPFETITTGKNTGQLLRRGFSLIHLHDINELPRAMEISRRYRLPLLLTVHYFQYPLLMNLKFHNNKPGDIRGHITGDITNDKPHNKQNNITRALKNLQVSGIIAPDYYLYKSLQDNGNTKIPAWFIPEGIEQNDSRTSGQYAKTQDDIPTSSTLPTSPTQPAQPKMPSSPYHLLFFGEEKGFSPHALHYLAKAAYLAGLNLNVMAPPELVQNSKSCTAFPGQYLGHQFDPLPFLSRASIAVTSGRGAAEAMSCGCATIVLGYRYGGIIPAPGTKNKTAYPDLSGAMGSDPCYKDIFYHLQELIKNRDFLLSAKRRARDFARKNFNLKLVAEQTIRVYEKII